MNILIDYRVRETDLLAVPVEELTRFVLASEGKPQNTEVSISFVSDEVMAELNARYRGLKGPTDVLSFECDNVIDEVSPENHQAAVYELGDVIIAPDVAEAQSYEYGTSFEEEISLLLVHGLLHLCGYDHIQDDEAEVMEARESELLNAWTSR